MPPSVLIYLVVFLLNCASLSKSDSGDTAALQEISLLVLLPERVPGLPPIYQPSYDEGPSLYLAAEVAADMVRNSSLLQGYRLNLLRENSGCNVEFRALKSIGKPLLESALGRVKPVVGVIGPICSLASLSVSILSGRRDVALINIPLAGTHRLQDRAKYPYSFSVSDSSRQIARTIVSLTQAANWTKAALFYDTSRLYYSSVEEMIREEANQTSEYLEPVGVSNIDLTPILSIGNDFRVIVLLVSTDLLSKIMCIAFHNQYSYPSYQYILDAEEIIVSSVEFDQGQRTYKCSRNQVWNMLVGSLQIRFQVERQDSNLVTESGISLQTFRKMYNEKLDSFNSKQTNKTNKSEWVKPSFNGALFYDALWSYVLALNAVMNETDLAQYRFGQPNVTNLIGKKLVSNSFEGLSGRIAFDEVTGHVDQNVQVFLINEVMNVTYIAHYRKQDGSIIINEGKEGVFIKDRFEERILTLPKPLIHFALAVIFLAFMLTLVLNILTCVHRNVDSVKASSTKLSQVAFIGCYILAVSMLFVALIFGFSDRISGAAICKIQHLLDFTLSVGLTVLLGAICVRIWRLHRIFNRFRDPGRLLSDRTLILTIVGLVAIDLVLTIPAFFVQNYEPTHKKTRSNNLIMVVVTCERSTPGDFFLWFTGSLLVSAVLLMAILALSILTRKIPQKNFKTKSVMYLSYTLTSVVPFLIGIYFIFSSLSGFTSMVLRFSTLYILLLGLILIPCAMLFFPPFIPMLQRHEWWLKCLSAVSTSPGTKLPY